MKLLQAVVAFATFALGKEQWRFRINDKQNFYAKTIRIRTNEPADFGFLTPKKDATLAVFNAVKEVEVALIDDEFVVSTLNSDGTPLVQQKFAKVSEEASFVFQANGVENEVEKVAVQGRKDGSTVHLTRSYGNVFSVDVGQPGGLTEHPIGHVPEIAREIREGKKHI